MAFNIETMTAFQPAKTLVNHAPGSLITSLDFSDSGQWILSAGSDESIQLYDCRSGNHSKVLPSKKYGCHLARFTHRSTDCIYASTKEEDSIRYLSLQDNQFVRYFRGHKNKVNSLEVSPIDDTVISSALDRTVRLWDLRSPNCQGLLSVSTPALVSFDAMGMVFSVASQDTRTVALYDVRNFDKAPFKSFSAHHVEGSWQKIEFSNDSKLIALASDGNTHGLFDAMDGSNRGVVTGHQPIKRGLPSTSPISFTMDGKYLVGGGNDSRVCIWDMAKTYDGTSSSIYTPVHETPAGSKPALITFSPKTMLMATADQALQFWIPSA